MTRALMFKSHVPAQYYPEAIATANYLTNRLPTKSLQFQTPLATMGTFCTIPSCHSLLLVFLGVWFVFTFQQETGPN